MYTRLLRLIDRVTIIIITSLCNLVPFLETFVSHLQYTHER